MFHVCIILVPSLAVTVMSCHVWAAVNLRYVEGNTKQATCTICSTPSPLRASCVSLPQHVL